MSYRSNCVKYTTQYMVCGHHEVSVQPCRDHGVWGRQAWTESLCKPIKLTKAALRLCASCREKNPYADEFDSSLPIRTSDEAKMEEDYSLAWLQSTNDLVQPEMPAEPATTGDDDECGWKPESDSKATRRSIGVQQLEQLETLLQHELHEHPIPVSRKRECPRKQRPAGLPKELPELRTTAKPMILVYSKPELVEVNQRLDRDELFMPPPPPAPHELSDSPRVVYKPYRRTESEPVEPSHVPEKDEIKPSLPRELPNSALVVYEPYRRSEPEPVEVSHVPEKIDLVGSYPVFPPRVKPVEPSHVPEKDEIKPSLPRELPSSALVVYKPCRRTESEPAEASHVPEKIDLVGSFPVFPPRVVYKPFRLPKSTSVPISKNF